MADTIKPDICVVGAGATAIALALAAAGRGASVVLIDRGAAEAGDPAQGRLAGAALHASAARAQAIRTAGRVGLDNAEPKPSFRAISEHAAAVAAAAAPAEAEERLVALGISYLTGAPAFTDRRTIKVGETLVRARHVVLATGAAPVIPALPGLDQVPFFTPDTIGANIRKLSHLVVIGGDAAALELAQAYRRLGSEVTLVPQGPLLTGFDPELVAILLGALREEGVAVLEGADVTAVVPRSQGTGIELRRADGSADLLDVSHILVAMGRQPDIGDWLDKARLKPDRLRPDRLQLGPGLQTSNRHISAIGGAAGEEQPAVVARQAEIVLDRVLLGSRARLDPLRVPRLVMTEPALAQIGLMETGAPLRPGQVVLRASLAETHAVRAAGVPVGSAKLVVGRNGAILGGGMVGLGAGEVVAILALALSRGFHIGDLEGLLLPEPSPAAVLTQLAAQHRAQTPPSAWTSRRMALRRLLP